MADALPWRGAAKRGKGMVVGYHVIFCAYGFWLPNDPRGSWSDFVGAWEISCFGRATKTGSRRSLAGKSHDRSTRRAAKRILKYAPVHFSGVQARAIGCGFGNFIAKHELIVWACSILPDHVHLIIARHRYDVEFTVNLLKGSATRQLSHEGLHPFAAHTVPNQRPPTPWARGLWKVFLHTEADIRRSIGYVEHNPVRDGKPPQKWPFVTQFTGLA